MKTAYLGLGSNLGDRRALLSDAVRRLTAVPDVRVTRLSSVFETAPVGVTAQPDFLNMVAEVSTSLPPRELLSRCLDLETALGRVRRERWGPRTIDIDVLWYEGPGIAEADLTLPHPRIAERAFVLMPLAEVAPALQLEGGTVGELAHRCDRTGLRLLGPLGPLPA